MISEQTREKLSIAAKNSYTDELREIRRQAMIKRYSDPEARELQSQRMKLALDNNITRARMSEGQMGHTLSEEGKTKLSKAHKGKIMAEEARKKISEARQKQSPPHLGHHHSPEAKVKMRAIKLGKTATKETKIKMSETGKKLWRLPAHRDKLVKASRLGQLIHPNKPEILLLSLLNTIAPDDWAFVGDGQLIIGGKNPDFANVNGKKLLVEMFGDYWHGEKARCYEETEEGRVKLFKKFGFSMLIIWESELKEPKKVLSKIAEFSAQ